MTRYSRQDVLRILHISARQLQGWERAGLIPPNEMYGFAELAQLRTLRELQHMRMRPRSIRDSVEAMQAASGMTNPLLESKVGRSGARLVFRHSGMILDPIRQQLVFDFEAANGPAAVTVSMLSSALFRRRRLRRASASCSDSLCRRCRLRSRRRRVRRWSCTDRSLLSILSTRRR